ncbi:hypothetical protein C0J52_00724 [Blattella germanica]|nr:hypothetical protein C0J52_00724 [Blattella germanica]
MTFKHRPKGSELGKEYCFSSVTFKHSLRVASWRNNTVLRVLVSTTFAFPVCFTSVTFKHSLRVASWRNNTVLRVLVSTTFAFPYSLCHHAGQTSACWC